MIVAVLNGSKHVSDADVATMAEACHVKIARDVATAWAMSPVPVIFFKAGSVLPPGARAISVIDDDKSTPDALGWHTEAGGRIYGQVMVAPVLDNGGAPLAGKDPSIVTVASVLDHEVGEMFIDPYANSWSDGPTLPQGSSYAFEGYDPVEADGYFLQLSSGLVVTMSNFVYPHWFDPGGAGRKLDHLGKLSAPFTMDQGGYMIVRNAPGSEQQVFGEAYPEWRKATKASSTSRTAQRLGA